MKDVLKELINSKGSKEKIQILKENDREIIKKTLKMTYDKINHKFYLTMKNVNFPSEFKGNLSLSEALSMIEENLCTRKITGNKSIEFVENILKDLDKSDAEIITKMINRDLSIGLNSKSINKAFKKLIPEFPYMRCSLADKLDKIKYPAIIQEKMDGTYRSVVVEDGEIQIFARSGEESNLPKFSNQLKSLKNGVYIGELMVADMEDDRYGSNGLINSDTEPEGIYMVSWDYLTLDEWKEGKSNLPYENRFENLKNNIDNVLPIYLVKRKIVNDFDEAREFYLKIVESGGEGAVLKNLDNKFKNGTATDNIKMKEEAVAEFIITNFQEGEGRLKDSLGALNIISQDGKVVSKVSGFSDKMREDIWKNRENLKGKIVSVKYNGVSKAKNSETYSLMFAQFEEIRDDKDVADDLEYIKNALK